jgi:hypothetical protein
MIWDSCPSTILQYDIQHSGLACCVLERLAVLHSRGGLLLGLLEVSCNVRCCDCYVEAFDSTLQACVACTICQIHCALSAVSMLYCCHCTACLPACMRPSVQVAGPLPRLV